MNLYKYHTNPDQLKYSYKEATEKVPHFAWNKYSSNKKELQKREDLWAQDAVTAYRYALLVLNGPFPAAESIIARDSELAYNYAYYVLEKPWPAGEPAIARDAYWSYQYSHNVLKKKRFPLGEPAIARDQYWASLYADKFNLKLVNGRFVPK